MKNVEKKELLKVLDGFIKNDHKENLLQLIENGIIDERMCQSEHWEVREKLAKNGYFIEILINDEILQVIHPIYSWLIENNKLEQKHIDLALQQDNIEVLLLLIENKIIDKRMCYNKNIGVRYRLAEKGHFINILIKDESEYVLLAIYEWLIKNNKLEQKYIDYVIQQDNYAVLLLLLKNSIVNEKMCQSRHYKIREELVKKGYFIEVLINDKNKKIKHQAYECLAYEWLIKANKLKQQYIEQLFLNKDYETLQFLMNLDDKNELIDKEYFLKKIKEFQEENKNNLSLLINNRSKLKAN